MPHLHRDFAAVDTATFSWIRSATALVSLQLRVCPTKTPDRAVMLLFNQITTSCASSVSASAEHAPSPMIKKLQWIASRPRHGIVQVPLTTAPQIQGLRRLGLNGTPSLGIHRQSFDELNRLRFTTGASNALRTSRNATNTIPNFFEHFVDGVLPVLPCDQTCWLAKRCRLRLPEHSQNRHQAAKMCFESSLQL